MFTSILDTMLEGVSHSYGPETEYLIKNLGPVLRECIADVVRKRPKDPIEHLAHCLHRHAEVAELMLREKLEAEAMQDADRARQQYLEEREKNETSFMEASVSENQQTDLLSAELKFSTSDLSGSGEAEGRIGTDEMNVDNADEPSVKSGLPGWLYGHRMKETNDTQRLGKGVLICGLIASGEQCAYDPILYIFTAKYFMSNVTYLKAYLQQAFFTVDLFAVGTDLTPQYGITEYTMLISLRSAAALH
ncbi:hypothetical protein X801_02155 [Opisthorchis viverrini]|uniref:Uncharacterized protein n=1 Tax=Opisthorchis viverrini TaxID=6198 RepID=A0A1S8X5E8_OPIVI|nr:hypothetical protein X801_02155 [Opisthorchis viverrini]